jgi:hypothetical protein
MAQSHYSTGEMTSNETQMLWHGCRRNGEFRADIVHCMEVKDTALYLQRNGALYLRRNGKVRADIVHCTEVKDTALYLR